MKGHDLPVGDRKDRADRPARLSRARLAGAVGGIAGGVTTRYLSTGKGKKMLSTFRKRAAWLAASAMVAGSAMIATGGPASAAPCSPWPTCSGGPGYFTRSLRTTRYGKPTVTQPTGTGYELSRPAILCTSSARLTTVRARTGNQARRGTSPGMLGLADTSTCTTGG
jgi:hypothetical protein